MQVRLESFLPMVSLYFTNLQVVIHQEMQQCTISHFSLLAISVVEDILLTTKICIHVQFIWLFQYLPRQLENVYLRIWCSPYALPESERSPTAPLTALHQGWWLFQQVGIFHLSKTLLELQLLELHKHIDLLRFWVCGVYVWERKISKPHQRTAVFDGGCVWAPSAPGSSSSRLLGWCWSPSAHFPASQRWPVSNNQQALTVMETMFTCAFTLFWHLANVCS